MVSFVGYEAIEAAPSLRSSLLRGDGGVGGWGSKISLTVSFKFRAGALGYAGAGWELGRSIVNTRPAEYVRK